MLGHNHRFITAPRYDTGDPKPNQLTTGLSFQFSYPDGGWYNALNMKSYHDSNYLSTQIVSSANNPGSDIGYSYSLKYREGRNETWLGWKTIWDSSNLRSDAQNDARYVDLTKTQTIGGVKSFTSNAKFTTIEASGTLTALGGNSTNWNSAYGYSQVGHLPLTGGRITTGTGDVNLEF